SGIGLHTDVHHPRAHGGLHGSAQPDRPGPTWCFLMKPIDPGRWSYRLMVGVTLAFVMAPLAAVIWVSFFANKIVGFPPTGYTVEWYARAWELVDFREGFLVTVQVGL